MDKALVNGRVLLDGGLEEGLAVRLSGGRIAAVGRADEVASGAVRRDLDGQLLLPGFIDLQVNGGAGVLFNDNPTPEAIAEIGRAHRLFGTTGFLPTLISDDLEVVALAIEAVRAAIRAGTPGVLGVHIEGPFLNVRRKGIHDPSKFRELGADLAPLLSSLETGRTLVTLAPEKTRPEVISALVEAGVVVSAGHTNAHYATVRTALDHGLSAFTHLFNAMSPLTSREPGVVGAALEDQSSWCGIIVDGLHVDPVVLKLALKCKPLDRFVLVTDAMPSVGMVGVDFTLQGRAIKVKDDICVDEHGTIAGSNLDMASAVRNAMQMLGLDLSTAVRMASRHPAEQMGLGHELGRIAPGYKADLVMATDTLEVLETWIGGEESAESASGAPLSRAMKAAHGPV
jgi:N-acetylglucosamine-6-phosphate deacetylase